jgi:hypothetical protein
MKITTAALLVTVLAAAQMPARSESISRGAAVEAAERFVVQNGYTDASATQVKERLDPESLERSMDRAKLLSARFNTLKPKAIGLRHARRGRPQGWSVAFDYMDPPTKDVAVCRVVTMAEDGSEARMEHVDGFRSYFSGFEP